MMTPPTGQRPLELADADRRVCITGDHVMRRLAHGRRARLYAIALVASSASVALVLSGGVPTVSLMVLRLCPTWLAEGGAVLLSCGAIVGHDVALRRLNARFLDCRPIEGIIPGLAVPPITHYVDRT